MNVICSLPFYVLWLVVAFYALRGGWKAYQWQEVIYRWPTPMGRMVVTMQGRAVAIIGMLQAIIGALLLLALVAAILNFSTLNAIFGALVCVGLPIYALTVRILMRRLTVISRHAWR